MEGTQYRLHNLTTYVPTCDVELCISRLVYMLTVGGEGKKVKLFVRLKKHTTKANRGHKSKTPHTVNRGSILR